MNDLFNKLSSLRPKKTYLVSKLQDETKLEQIKTCFEEPDKYLRLNPKMVVGKVIKGPRMDDENKIISYSVVGPPAIFENPKLLKGGVSLKYSTKSNSVMAPVGIYNRKVEERQQKKLNYESIDEYKLKTIYSTFNNLKVLNSNKVNEFMKKLPEEVNKSLNTQEKILNKKYNFDSNTHSMSRYLSKRVKKSEEELLMNKTDNYRLKKEIAEVFESKKTVDEKYGVYSWMIGLRKPENFNGSRLAYVNYGDNYQPLWLGVRETNPKQQEVVRKPNSYAVKDLKKNNKYLINTTDLANINELEGLNDLQVRGHDLLKSEIDFSSALTGKKILYKKEYMDSVGAQGANPLNTNEFEKNTNMLTQPRTFDEKYETSSYFRRKKLKNSNSSSTFGQRTSLVSSL